MQKTPIIFNTIQRTSATNTRPILSSSITCFSGAYWQIFIYPKIGYGAKGKVLNIFNNYYFFLN